MIEFLAFVLPILITFTTTVACIILLEPLAKRLGLVDTPGGRKQHAGQIPLIGGVAMFIAFITSAMMTVYPINEYRALFLGSAVLVFIGVLDDFRELTAKARLVAQLVAVGLLALWGKRYILDVGDLFFLGHLQINLMWSVPFTLFAATSLINAVNMTDGLDGLAGGLSLVSITFMLMLGYLKTTNAVDIQLLSMYAAALLGFLTFNLRLGKRQHARIFMGDAGSLFLGFALAWFSISLTQSEIALARPVTMLWFIALPLSDLLTVFIRRLKNQTSPLKPGRDHIHHLLLAKGFTVNQTLALMLGAAMICGAVGLLGELYQIHEGFMFIGFLLCYSAYLMLTKQR